MREQGRDGAKPGFAVEAPVGALETEDARQRAVSSENRCCKRVQVALALPGRLAPAALPDPVHGSRELDPVGDRPRREALEPPARERNVAEGEEDLPRRGGVRDARAAETCNALDGGRALHEV